MRENRQYYYLKLKDSFFDQASIRMLRRGRNGTEKSMLYLMLCLQSLKHNGLLMLNEETPYTVEDIALVTGFTEKKVSDGVESMLRLGLLETSKEGGYYVTDIETLVGRSSTEGERKRRERLRIIKGIEEPEALPEKEGGQGALECPPVCG